MERRGEERRCQDRREGGSSVNLKPGCKVKEREEERVGGGVWRRRRRSRRESQTRQVSLCSSLHSTLGRSCSSGAGCLNLGNQLNKTWWGNRLLFFFFAASNTAPFFSLIHLRGSLSSRLAAPPFSLFDLKSGVRISVCLLFYLLLRPSTWIIPQTLLSCHSASLPMCVGLSLQPWSSSSLSSLLALHTCAPPGFLYLYFFQLVHTTAVLFPPSLSVCLSLRLSLPLSVSCFLLRNLRGKAVCLSLCGFLFLQLSKSVTTFFLCRRVWPF